MDLRFVQEQIKVQVHLKIYFKSLSSKENR